MDGYIARRFPSQISAFGSFLDPLADKILISVLFVSLTLVKLIPREYLTLNKLIHWGHLTLDNLISKSEIEILKGFPVRLFKLIPLCF